MILYFSAKIENTFRRPVLIGDKEMQYDKIGGKVPWR
jgi:hypothetical protein